MVKLVCFPLIEILPGKLIYDLLYEEERGQFRIFKERDFIVLPRETLNEGPGKGRLAASDLPSEHYTTLPSRYSVEHPR